MSLWFEVWTRPGDPNFRRLLDDIPFREASIFDAMGDVGGGSATVPDTWPFFDIVLKVAGANSAASLVRLRNRSGDIAFEWIPNQIVPVEGKQDPYVTISGNSMKEILKYGVTLPYDYDGTLFQRPSIPNWQWGSENILGNPGFEESTAVGRVYELIVDATGGSFTLSDGTDTTSALDWDASAGAIEDAIENELGAFTDVAVARAGALRRIIQYVNPSFGPTLTIDDSGLTGGADPHATLTVTVEGELQMSPWQAAHALVTGAPTKGTYDELRVVSINAHSGNNSLQVNPGPTGESSNRNGGFQQLVSVTPGGLYQAGIWIRPTSTADLWRLALWTVGEEPIAWSVYEGQSYPAGVYTLVEINNIIIPDHIDQVIFRLSNTNPHPHDAGATYFDDAFLYPGLPADTPGAILTLLYESYVNPSLRSPILWEDGANPGTPYLTLDFDAVNDSGGVAWFDQNVSMEVWMRMTFWDVLKEFESQYGLEFRVVPDDPEAGTWLLQVYNPGGMDDAPDVAIMGGARDTRRRIRRYRPSNVYVIEGQERSLGVGSIPALTADFGRIEVARLDRELKPFEDTVMDAVAQDVIDGPIVGEVWSYEQTDPVDEIGSAYRLGDTVVVHDPPEVDTEARTWDYTATISPEGVVWDVDYIAPEPEESP